MSVGISIDYSKLTKNSKWNWFYIGADRKKGHPEKCFRTSTMYTINVVPIISIWYHSISYTTQTFPLDLFDNYA